MKINEKLYALCKVNTKPDFVNRRLYRILYNEDFYVLAYENIKANAGILTPGITYYTADGANMDRVRKLIAKLKDESYSPKPCRRVYIPKANGKLRPLGLPDYDDKLVQEAVRIILESIYDSPNNPTFLDQSFGFRRGLGCHSALKSVYENFQYCAWIIKADVKEFFCNVDHHVLTGFLRKRISDERFIRLIWKFLRAGYIDDGVFVSTLKGTPQGGIVSPVLANIYLHEFDLFIEQIKTRYGTDMAPNPEHRKIVCRLYKARKKSRALSKQDESFQYWQSQIDKNKAILDRLPSKIPAQPDKGVIYYARYADDWIIGIKGSKQLTKHIYKECERFFTETLKLEWNKKKSAFYRSIEKPTEFLGVDMTFTSRKSTRRLYRIHKSGRKYVQRTISVNAMNFRVDVSKLLKRLRDKGFLNSQNKPVHNTKLINLDDTDIIKSYRSVFIGIFNYYQFVHNIAVLAHIHYLLKTSLAKTLAGKYKTSTPKIYRKYGSDLTFKTKSGKEINFKRPSFKRNPRAFRTKSVRTDWALELLVFNVKSKSWLRSNKCCLCSSEDRIQMHHVRHIRKTGKKYFGFHKVMGYINRKQIPVCHKCHWKIHNGEYDGENLGQLADRIKADLGITYKGTWRAAMH